MAIIQMVINRPVSTLLLFIGGVLMGVLSLFIIPREFYPEVEQPKLVVFAPYESSSTEDLRSLVTLPLEEALSSLRGLQSIQSISQPGFVLLEISLQWGSDMRRVGIQAREIIDRVFSQLPQNIQKPRVIPIDLNEVPLLTLIAIPKDTKSNIKKIIDNEVRTELQQVDGVSNLILIGGQDEEFWINIKEEHLLNRGYNLSQISSLIKKTYMNYPVGTLEVADQDLLVKIKGKGDDLESLRNLFLLNQGGEGTFCLKDVASFHFHLKEQRSYFAFKGVEGIGIYVRKQQGANPISLAKAVKEEVDRLNIRFKGQFTIKVLKDQSLLIKNYIHSLILSLVLGMIISFLTIYFFSGSLKASLIIFTSIPISFLITIAILNIMNLSLNIISLGGIALAIGMLVDNSVLVLDHLFCYQGTDSEQLIKGTKEIALPIFGSTMSSIIIFLPLLFLPGIIGSLYKDLALTISVSLFVSFITSLSLIPVFYRILSPISHKERPLMEKIKKNYKKGLQFIILKPRLWIPILLLLFSPLFLLPSKVSFKPFLPPSSFDLEFFIQYPPGTRLSWIKNESNAISEILSKLPDIDSFFSRIGAEKDDLYYLANSKENASRLKFYLKVKNPKRIKKIILREFDEYYKIQITPPKDPILSLLGLSSNSDYLLTGENRTDLNKNKNSFIKFSQKVYSSYLFSPDETLLELHINPKGDRLSKAGLTLIDLGRTLNIFLEGKYCGFFTQEGTDYPLKVISNKKGEGSLEQRSILTPEGQRVSVGQLASISWESCPAKMLRVNKKDSLWITIPSKKDRIQSYIKDSPFICEADGSLLKKYSQEILFLFCLSFVILYLFLGVQFESFKTPLLVLTTTPFAILGTLYALMLGRGFFSIQSALAIILLMGLVVNNGIILIDSLKHFEEDIVAASLARLRPILMTSFTTIFSMVPLMFNIFGETGQSGIAIAIFGGSLLSLFISLFFLPTLLNLKNNKEKRE